MFNPWSPRAKKPAPAPRRTSGPWRGRRYAFRPHNGLREKVRRLRQIVNGQLVVPYDVRLEAQENVLAFIRRLEQQKQAKQRTGMVQSG